MLARFVRYALVAIVALTFAPMAIADDVSDELGIAQAKYAEGDIQGALEAVRLVEAWLLERLADSLTGIFGDIPGWEKEIPQGQAAGGAYMGGGASASCRYTKDNQEIDINVIGNSPMLGMAMSMISNPMIASSSGGKIVKVNGRKALLKETNSRWELMVPYENSVLIDIKTDASKDDALAAADAIDYETLDALLTAQ